MLDTTKKEWIVIWREKPDDKWQVHRHHAYGTPFRFKDPVMCGGAVRAYRRNDKEAMAVRETVAETQYGVCI